MLKLTASFLILAAVARAAEISSSYSSLEKLASFSPDFNTAPIDGHNVLQKETKNIPESRPVYRNEPTSERRSIEPPKPQLPDIKHSEMLADQPATGIIQSDNSNNDRENNRVDKLTIPHYGLVPNPMEVAYPDIPYAPGYGYDNAYAPSNNYDYYGTGLTNYLEPETSISSLLWSQVPDSRTIVSYIGRSILWVFNSVFVLLMGSFLTIGMCSYTNLCTFNFNGVGTIREEMRSLMTPDRLEKISTAADFVKNAIDKYQKIQHSEKPKSNPARKRRSFFYQ